MTECGVQTYPIAKVIGNAKIRGTLKGKLGMEERFLC